MALHSSARPSSKLIFAPGEASPNAGHHGDDGTSSAPASTQAAQFQIGTLARRDLDPNPFTQFHKWFSEPALKGTNPETVTLSTAELPSGRVSSRMVYLKELDEKGFVVYSNFGTSRKAQDIATNPYASLCFWWKPLERQVRIEGPVERLTPEESQVYYDTRARGSRIGAWASEQSTILRPSFSPDQDENENEDEDEDDGRRHLETRVHDIETRFKDQDHIPVPDFWGGLRIVPETVEFWQGRDSRLHDRFRYTHADPRLSSNLPDLPDVKKGGGGNWRVDRLSP